MKKNGKGRPRASTMRAVSLAVAAALMLALTGCGPVDAGSSAADAFERDFADVDGVASIETGAHNDLPFMGSVDAHVTAQTDLSDAEVDELAATFSEYMRSHSANVGWNSSLTAGAVTVGVDEDEETSAKHLEVARDLMAVPHVQRVEVGLAFSDERVLVSVDSPEMLTQGYLAAASAVRSLGVTDGRSNAHAITGSPGFGIDDMSWDGDAPDIMPALTAYEMIRTRFTLSGAAVTPDELHVRTASDDDVSALQEFVSSLSTPADLAIDVQGGVTTMSEPTEAASVVTDALADLEVSTAIRTSNNYVNVTVPAAADAETVLDAIGDLPEFRSLSGFGLSTADTEFSVFDRPADFPGSLAIAQAGYSLPGIDAVDVRETDADEQEPTARFEFSNSDEATISAFASTMKPLLLERGWHTWINADGSVEWFTAADPLVLDDPIGVGRDAEGQRFADMLVRLWDAAPR